MDILKKHQTDFRKTVQTDFQLFWLGPKHLIVWPEGPHHCSRSLEFPAGESRPQGGNFSSKNNRWKTSVQLFDCKKNTSKCISCFIHVLHHKYLLLHWGIQKAQRTLMIVSRPWGCLSQWLNDGSHRVKSSDNEFYLIETIVQLL